MHRRNPNRARRKKHTEFQLSLTIPVAQSPALPGQLFTNLLEVIETKIQPEATIELGPSEQLADVLLYLMRGTIEIDKRPAGFTTVDSGQIATVRIESGEPAFLRNPSSELSRVVEIWIKPQVDSIPAENVAVHRIELKESRGTLLPVASGQLHPDTVPIYEDVAAYLSHLYPPERLIFETLPERSTFIFLVEGHLRVGEERIYSGDSLAIWRESLITIAAHDRSEFILIDLP